jgi:hypothetical protein
VIRGLRTRVERLERRRPTSPAGIDWAILSGMRPPDPDDAFHQGLFVRAPDDEVNAVERRLAEIEAEVEGQGQAQAPPQLPAPVSGLNGHNGRHAPHQGL